MLVARGITVSIPVRILVIVQESIAPTSLYSLFAHKKRFAIHSITDWCGHHRIRVQGIWVK